MFTGVLSGEVIDLRQIPRVEQEKLHADRRVPVKCRGCGGRAHVRLHRGDDDLVVMYTFAHNPGEAEKCRQLGFHIDESPQHHALKGHLADAATSRGWKVDLEVPGDRCRADVVAEKNGIRRVMEAQLASLSVQDAVERTERYERSFGQTLWTHTGFRPWSKQVESVRVDEELDQVIGGIFKDQGGNEKHEPLAIKTAVGDILSGKFRYIYFEEAAGTAGYFYPVDGPATRRRERRRPLNESRGSHVRECARPIERGIRCADCGHVGPAGVPCLNDSCQPKSCPVCGYRPWHDLATCPSCSTDEPRSARGRL